MTYDARLTFPILLGFRTSPKNLIIALLVQKLSQWKEVIPNGWIKEVNHMVTIT